MKQKLDTNIINLYFKLLAYNISFFTLDKCFLEKINNNIKIHTTFLQSLIRQAVDVKKVNIANFEINISAIITLAANSRKNHYSQNTQSKSQKKITFFEITRARVVNKIFILQLVEIKLKKIFLISK